MDSPLSILSHYIPDRTYCHTHTYIHTYHTIGSPEEKEEGGSVYEVLDHKGRPIPKGEEVHEGVVTLSFGR